MSTVQQKSVKATFFKVVRAAACIRLFIGNSLSLSSEKICSYGASPLGEFSAYGSKRKPGNQKVET
jgi:hypothetical protein